jgi:cytochrome c-type biogenesis protein CcmH
MSGNVPVADLMFWALLALMAGGAVALLLTTRSWLAFDEGEGEQERGRGGRDMDVYRDQLRELDSEVARGLLTEALATSARLEVERRLLAADRELSGAPQAAAFSPGLRRRSLGALMVLIPALSLGLYLVLGFPGLPGQPFDSRNTMERMAGMGMAEDAPDIPAPDIATMVARLSERLQRMPEDLDGWKMLAQSYLVLERPLDAQDVLWRGLKYFPRDPDLLLTTARLEVVLAQAEETEAGRSGAAENAGEAGEDTSLGESVPVIPSEAARLFRRLLVVAPDHGEALWTVGLAEAQAGNRDEAAVLWRRLLAKMPEEFESRAALQSYLDALKSQP